MNFYSPFEQFQILPVINLNTGNIDFSFSNASFALLCILMVLVVLVYMLQGFSKLEIDTLKVSISDLEKLVFLFFNVVQSAIEKHIHLKIYQQLLFPVTLGLGTLLLFFNIFGVLPFYFSLTSQFAVVCALVFPVSIGSFLWVAYERGLTFVRTFYAPGTPLLLAIILFPIEFFTFMLRPISIVCRLCANIMAGHVILKVAIYSLLELTKTSVSILFISSFLSSGMFILSIIFILEFCVGLIQVYVFLVIYSIFLNDTFGHHYSH